MGCKDSVLTEPLLKNRKANCQTFEKNTRKPYKDNLCLFRADALLLFGNERLEQETSKFFNVFLKICGEADPSKFQGVLVTDIPKADEMLQLNIFLYDIDFVVWVLIGELARRSLQKFEKSVKILLYNDHICYVSDIDSFFKYFRCSTCDTIFSKTGNLERHLITCSDRVKHTYTKMFNSSEKHTLKSWSLSLFHTERIKSWLKRGRLWFWIYLRWGRGV